MRVFIEKGRIQSLHFRSNFDTPLSPEDGWNQKKKIKIKKKKKKIARKNFSHWAIQIALFHFEKNLIK